MENQQLCASPDRGLCLAAGCARGAIGATSLLGMMSTGSVDSLVGKIFHN